jgi:hypothetical protein
VHVSWSTEHVDSCWYTQLRHASVTGGSVGKQSVSMHVWIWLGCDAPKKQSQNVVHTVSARSAGD